MCEQNGWQKGQHIRNSLEHNNELCRGWGYKNDIKGGSQSNNDGFENFGGCGGGGVLGFEEAAPLGLLPAEHNNEHHSSDPSRHCKQRLVKVQAQQSETKQQHTCDRQRRNRLLDSSSLVRRKCQKTTNEEQPLTFHSSSTVEANQQPLKAPLSLHPKAPLTACTHSLLPKAPHSYNQCPSTPLKAGSLIN